MKTQKTIAVFTSIRSEYGLMRPLLAEIEKDPLFELRLLVGGAHLSRDFGMTIAEIENDGVKVDREFPFLFSDGRPGAAARAIAILAMEIACYFEEKRPDVLVVLGDRFELLPVVNAALVMNIPIAHISGGDTTEGAIDNQIRHAISKMASLHFPTTDSAKETLLKMGEENWRICVSGELGLDEIREMEFIPRESLYRDLALPLDLDLICVTFHPETINNEISGEFVASLMKSLLARFSNFQVLATASNFDTGGQEINDALSLLAEKESRLTFVKSLGKLRYFSILKNATLVLGNSSSGLSEVQSFNIPVVNVGKRQQGRLANVNVVNAEVDAAAILSAVEFALTDDFRTKFENKLNVYGKRNTVRTIVDFITRYISHPDILMKKSVVWEIG